MCVCVCVCVCVCMLCMYCMSHETQQFYGFIR